MLRLLAILVACIVSYRSLFKYGKGQPTVEPYNSGPGKPSKKLNTNVSFDDSYARMMASVNRDKAQDGRKGSMMHSTTDIHGDAEGNVIETIPLDMLDNRSANERLEKARGRK
jgi:hypothetical protein